MQRTARTLFVAWLAVLASCEHGPGDDDAAPAEPGLEGLLIDANEQPLAGVQVLACQATSCLYAESGADGRFSFEIEPPADVALKTHAVLAGTPRMAAALEPVDIVDDARVDVGTLYVPDLPDGAVLGPASDDPQTLVVGDGLELTVNSADITPGIGEFLYDVAARRLPVKHVPAFPELDPADVIAVYAMHPFAARSSSPIAVRVPVDVPDGTPVEFRTLDELDCEFLDVLPGQIIDGHATSDPGTGITRITYLVISM